MSQRVPSVTVIMPVYNAERFLRAAVDSILNQTFADFEFLIVDDASADQSVEIVNSYRDPRIRLLLQEQNLGPAAARNRALDSTQSRYVAFFDADDIACPTRLAEQIRFITDHPRFQIVASRVEIIDQDSHATGACWGHDGAPETIGPILLFENCLANSTIFLETAAVAGQRFQASLSVASDYDLWVRLMEKSQACCLPQVLVRYRVHNANISHRKQNLLEQSIRQIALYQLSKLGIQPTPLELDVHRKLATEQHEITRELLETAETWLIKLEAGNRRTQRYPGPPFGEVLAAKWFSLCCRSRGLGWGVWKKFNRSALVDLTPSRRQQRYVLCRLVARACLKNAFPNFIRARQSLRRRPVKLQPRPQSFNHPT